MTPDAETTMWRVVAMIRDAALAEKVCPTNLELAKRIGHKSAAVVIRSIQRAELVGLITIRRGNCNRVVAAADGSWRTAGDVRGNHWRDKEGAKVLREAKERAVVVKPPVVPQPAVEPREYVPILDIACAPSPRGCLWPMWGHHERPSHIYCDRPRDGRVYCAGHADLAFTEGQA